MYEWPVDSPRDVTCVLTGSTGILPVRQPVRPGVPVHCYSLSSPPLLPRCSLGTAAAAGPVCCGAGFALACSGSNMAHAHMGPNSVEDATAARFSVKFGNCGHSAVSSVQICKSCKRYSLMEDINNSMPDQTSSAHWLPSLSARESARGWICRHRLGSLENECGLRVCARLIPALA